MFSLLMLPAMAGLLMGLCWVSVWGGSLLVWGSGLVVGLASFVAVLMAQNKARTGFTR